VACSVGGLLNSGDRVASADAPALRLLILHDDEWTVVAAAPATGELLARRLSWYPNPGYGATTPVGSFPPNRYGLHDMAGNVWEWTQDWYREVHATGERPCCVPRNPRGPGVEESFDPRPPQFRVPRKVIKGGSFLCADSYCRRYRPAARRPHMIDTGMSHIGFRCAHTADTAGK
jgi:formylglycine-generating enzyme required for sulfatase activity